VSPTTRFRIGSITKVLTAATALSLVRRGELSLTRPLTEYVPELRLAEPDAASGGVSVLLPDHGASLLGGRELVRESAFSRSRASFRSATAFFSNSNVSFGEAVSSDSLASSSCSRSKSLKCTGSI
jgi:hypothetical protein